MNKHKSPPVLCDECQKSITSQIETVYPNGAGIYCPHNMVFALIAAREGVIQSWTMEGPAPRERFQSIIKATSTMVEANRKYRESNRVMN